MLPRRPGNAAWCRITAASSDTTVALNLPTDEVFLTTEEVLEYLQVNLRTVYRLIKAGKIPAVRVGRQWRFRKRDIDAWLDSQRSRSGEAVPGASSAAAREGRHRVLVVDDEPSIRDLLAKTLALAEYDVDTAPDGSSALDRLRETRGAYDLMIADLRMPGMDGLTLDSRGQAHQREHPDHHHHRLLNRVERNRGGQPRSRRISHEAVPRPTGSCCRSQSAGRFCCVTRVSTPNSQFPTPKTIAGPAPRPWIKVGRWELEVGVDSEE